MALIFNGGTQPLVPAGRWGHGVIGPGEGIDVPNPESYGQPWTQDPEAEKALKRRKRATTAQKTSGDPPANQSTKE